MGRRLTIRFPVWLAVAATLAVSLQACTLSARRYPAPPTPRPPMIVGVIASATHDAVGYHTTLVDGRVVDAPQNGVFVLGPVDEPGWLLISSSAGGGYAIGLRPISEGCWEAWSSPSDELIVWDTGKALLFRSGVELPKAPGFRADPPSHEVDGRLAWTISSNQVGMSFCANSKGEIESGERQTKT